MLKSLDYSVTFPETGRTLAWKGDLHEGFWAITGPNESGKTMIFEMVRFLLFGVSALRGQSEQYKNLRAKGTFVIRGKDVQIERTIKSATFSRDGKPLASGVKAVNMKVLEELGFPMGVFDVANSINQGEVERLGLMKPAQRKAMIDSVLGLTALDQVSKWATDEARALDRQAEALRERLMPPGVPPVTPEGYIPSDQIDLDAARAAATELAEVTGWLSAPAAVKPEQPKETVALPSENLKTMAANRAALREEVEHLKAGIAARQMETPYTWEELDQFSADHNVMEKRQDAADWLRRHPAPEHSLQALKDAGEDWGRHRVWEMHCGHVDRVKDQLAAGDYVECIHCKTQTPTNPTRMEQLRQELETYQAVPPAQVDKPDISFEDVDKGLRFYETDDAELRANHKALLALAGPAYIPADRQQIATYRHALIAAKERAELEAELAVKQPQFDKMADFETMYAQRVAYEQALDQYKALLLTYQAWVRDRDAKKVRQAQLAGADNHFVLMMAAYDAARYIEQQLEAHARLVENHEKAMVVITDLENEAVEHRKVRDTMNLLRTLIKQHVLPSLNRVASHLISQMTGGQRNLVYIDEDFNVRVDQQDLETLSGSGKAVANLSIRIALGQVLTNGIISILLADEIDASMDAFRGEKTSGVLRMLEDNISQVLLVSHKAVEANNHIRLGDSNCDDDAPDQPD